MSTDQPFRRERFGNIADDLTAAVDWVMERRSGAIIIRRSVALASCLRPVERFDGCRTLADVAVRYGIPLRTLQQLRVELRRFGIVPVAVAARVARSRGSKLTKIEKLEAQFTALAHRLDAAPDHATGETIRAELNGVRRKLDFQDAINQTAGGHISIEAEAEAGWELAPGESEFSDCKAPTA